MEKGKRLKRHRSAKLRSASIHVIAAKDDFDVPGISKVLLSNVTQKIIECVVGENLHSENRWKYVKKEIIQDNLELHEDSSDFLPIKDEILKYEEEELLMGLAKENEEDPHQFYVCLSQEIKLKVLEVIAKKEEELNERLKNSVKKTVGVWSSLGSEDEVDEARITSIRPLIEVEVESAYPITESKVSFKMRMAEGCVDGYLELLPGRFPYKNISRKRIDNGTQAAPSLKNTEVQTDYKYPRNISTQYQYDYRECELKGDSNTKCTKFINTTEENLSEMINFNYHFNMHENDYETLANSETVVSQSEVIPEELFSFSDIKTCEGTLVTSISWHPRLSGILVISYAPNTFNYVKATPPKENEPINFHEATPVLIWSFTDYLKPKLYLTTNKYVSNVAFNPVNPNIVVGACINGQVEIWDITDRLEMVDSEEVLTAKEITNRYAIKSMMNWMKDIHDISIVPVTAISAFEFSHRDTINYMKFFPSYQKINARGQFEKLVDEDGNQTGEVNQFLTASFDGSMYIWDITLSKSEIEKLHAKSQKKTRRLKELPEALTSHVSPYRSFGNDFKPIYKILVKKSTGLNFPISTMSIPIKKIYYQPCKKTDTSGNTRSTDGNFERVISDGLTSRVYYLASMTGKIIQVQWEGYDFDTGRSLNTEKADVSECFAEIHDGPITRCISNHSFNEIVLTIGGTIFAVWNLNYKCKPLFWNRNIYARYTNGSWNSRKPASLILLRSDGVIELWNFGQNYRTYAVRIVIAGDNLLRIANTVSKFEMRNNTVAITNNAGVLRIFLAPDFINPLTSTEVTKFSKFTDREIRRKCELDNWNKEWKLKNKYTSIFASKKKETNIEQSVDESHDEFDNKSVKTIAPDYLANWVNRQERLMYETMLQRKKLNLRELEKYRKPLKLIADEENSRNRRKEIALQKKNEVFAHVKDTVLETTENVGIDAYSKHDLTTNEAYMEEYDQMETEFLSYINNNRFNIKFDWNKTVHEIRNKKFKLKRQYFTDLFHRYDEKFTRKYESEEKIVRIYSEIQKSMDDPSISDQISSD